MNGALWSKLHISDLCLWLERGLALFLFYLVLLTLARLCFIFWLGMGDGYLEAGTSSSDVMLAVWQGFKLSIQTTGILTVATIAPLAPFVFFSDKLTEKVANFTSGIVFSTMSVMFVASFPYYRQFHSRFNQLLFNTANDDVYALAVSLVQEFYLPLRLVAAGLLAYILWRIFWHGLYHCFEWINNFARLVRLVVLIIVYNLLATLSVYGGSFGWETAVDWENAGVTKNDFLNEAILDDFQAVYRGHRLNGRFLACNGLNFTTEQIRDLAAHMANRPADTDNLDVYLTRTAQGAQIERPKHIFVIISESFANWPMLDKYASLHIADGVKFIANAEDSDYCPTFLPNGSSTVSAVTGVVTGLADANLYLTTMPESFAAPYPTAAAPVMEQLGYDTNFWYAGPASWERVGAFTEGQGFNHFYGIGDMPSNATGSVWGCDDEYLYAEVLKRTEADKDSFNVILNVSNHSPYNLDLKAKGYPADVVKNGLPEECRSDDELLNQLGHYWYADREMTKFVTEIKKKYPDSLIVIMGDHADRYNMEKTPGMYERYGIPFIISGKGVHKGILDAESAGSQIDVIPTIVEMIAPKDFQYEAIGSSLTRGNKRGVNYGFWITRHSIGEADVYPLEPISIDGTAVELDQLEMSLYIDAVRSLSWWRPKYGPVLDEKLLEGRE